ncbi:ester cyclase [Exilibacterium tricleocarpae]|uniref:Ester cyclase n=1 Tax=Exilibacterium tricleocarpae TaxID=2591008 RepID=A0A545TVF3_9GAMM|nr:ester cyclase [Exilibacterium tricleocarpae]TQV81192.1 ester cyclase [Exilibacterium tricleocarpae]
MNQDNRSRTPKPSMSDTDHSIEQHKPLAVTTTRHTDISTLLQPVPGRRQAMAGFDREFVDIVDYIIRITHRIWEEKNVGLIYDYYSHNCPIHTLAGQSFGAEAAVQGTLKALGAFPDRTLYGDAVIWGGDDKQGFYSSHLITSTATNTGDSEFGPATGKKITFNTIADCVVKANRIVEEWLLRDNLSIALQLGLNPHAIAQRQAAADRELSEPFHDWRLGEIDRVRAQTAPGKLPIPDNPVREPEAFARAVMHEIWNRRMFGKVRDIYAANAVFQGPSGRRLYGHGEIIGNAIALMAALPDARISVDHVCAVATDTGEIDIALRWTLAGNHEGGGLYGAPSGRRIMLLAASHWRLNEGGKICAESTIYDELAVLRQVYGGG